MKDDDVDRRAKALADVILELLFAENFRDADRLRNDPDARSEAEAEAYWVVSALKDPAGEVGLYNAKTEAELLDTALKGLRKTEKAIRELASPVETELSRKTRHRRGATAPLLIRELGDALSAMKTEVERSARTQDRVPGRLDRRRWSAITAYLELRRLWERRRSPAARRPKDDDPFYEFAERGLQALEIPGIGGRKYASVRSVIEALDVLEKQGIVRLPELD